MDELSAAPPLDVQLPGLLGAIVLVLALGTLVAVSRLPQTVKTLLYAGLAFRVVGAITRYAILFGVYEGQGDAVDYYKLSLTYAERFWEFDFSPFVNTSLWRSSTWWGTQFIHFPTSVILSLLGPSMIGPFV